MDFNQTFAVSAAGMDLERRRLDVAALNLANADTVAGADGRRYQPQRVVAHGVYGKVGGFGGLLGSSAMTPQAHVEATGAPDRQVYEPGNPLADSRGFIAYPGVDHANEMMTIMSAMRAYEANVAAMTASRSMALKALDIGGGA